MTFALFTVLFCCYPHIILFIVYHPEMKSTIGVTDTADSVRFDTMFIPLLQEQLHPKPAPPPSTRPQVEHSKSM